jgi:hypothetical protein
MFEVLAALVGSITVSAVGLYLFYTYICGSVEVEDDALSDLNYTPQTLKVRSLYYLEGCIWATVEIPAVDFPPMYRYAIDEIGLEPDEAMVLPAHMLHGEWIITYPDGSGTVKRILKRLEAEEYE